MSHRLVSRRISLACLVILYGANALVPNRASAQGFPPVSPDELKMTSEPNAPGAPAIILFREVDSDDNGMTSHQDNYVRIKILTDEGRKYANVEIRFNKNSENLVNLHARTIQPDGSRTEFTGEIFEKTIAKVQGLRYLAKTFTLPDVQVGSIVEYGYTIDLAEHRVFSSHWILNEPLFTRYAKFSLKPYVSRTVPVNLRWSWHDIPAGASPKEGPDHVLRMEIQNVAAFQEEDYMPPPRELESRVDFVYEREYREADPDSYWRHVAKDQYEIVEKFTDKRKAMEETAAKIVAPADSPEVKLHKIYARVQQIRNKSYELRKTEQEQKREKEHPDENVEDVWKHGYGNHRQLNWLFLALVRAAGLDAYGVLISSRNDYFFAPKTMEFWKLNVGIVLVRLDGKDLYFDPGAEFNSYGMLTWSETGVQGLRLDKDGATWVNTPLPDASESRVQHKAKFKLSEDGSLEGQVTTTYTGLEAMYHRLDVRNADEVSRKKFLEDRVRNQIPVPSTVTLTNSPEWDSSEAPLVAEFTVTVPGWASAAGKRTVFPAGFFTAGEKRTFERANRVHPIYFRYPYQKEDDVTIELPAGWQVDSVPSPLLKDAHLLVYSLNVENGKTTLRLTRKLVINFEILDPKYYPGLRNFFQNIKAGDEQQIMIEPAAAAAAN